MANDFSSDSRFKAHWKFNDDLNDAIGGNNLTHSGTPTYSTDKIEGTKSLDLEKDSSEYASIADSALASGFPFKNGESNLKATIFWRMKLESNNFYQGIMGKRSGTTMTFAIESSGTDGDDFRFFWGHATGSEMWQFCSDMMGINVWYHFACIIDGPNKKVTILWYYDNLSLKLAASNTFTNALHIADVPFCIGTNNDGEFMDGKIDDVIVANECLGQGEVERILNQVYSGSGPKGAAAHQVLLEVLYEEPPEGQFTYGDANIPVAVDPAAAGYSAHYTYIGNITAEVDPAAESYLYQGPDEFIYANANIPVVVDPTAELTQKVPHYVGTVQVEVIPSGIYQNLVRIYQGNIEVEITPAATYGVPLVGWDKYYGYGLVQIDWLSGAPPFWVPTITGPTIELDPTAAAIALHAEFSHEAEGGIAISGYPELSITRPTTKSEVGRVGVAVGGASVLTVIRPKTISIVATGGVRLGGSPILKVSDASAIPTHSHVGYGGFLIGGSPTLTVNRPRTISITGQGGVRVMGTVQIPDVKVTRPSPFTDTKITVAHTVELEVGGDAELTITRPGTVTIDATPMALVVSGDAGLVVIRPKTIEVLGDGGLILGEEPVPEQCDTWVLSGSNQEPSVYTRFLFNSYALIQGKPHAAGNDGIYCLEGADDQGETIRSGLRIRQTNFGYDGPKRLRSVYLNEGNDNAEVRVETDSKAGYFPKTRGGWKVSRDLRGSEFIIDVANFEKLDHFEVIPFVLAKR